MSSGSSGRAWPLAIALGLGIVVLVNAAFAYVAVRTAPEIAPSYVQATER